MTTDNGVHERASAGFKDAANYDAYRPSYPFEAVDKLLKNLGIADTPHAHIVEIAAGTGKFTEQLAQRHEGYDVIAVEPIASMRQKLADKKLSGVEVLDGLAAKMPIEDEWGDACIAAQSFHWFANEEALAEIHRVLKPRCVLGMVWNIEDYNKPAIWHATTAWEQKLNELVFDLGNDGAPRFRDNLWRSVFERQLASNPLLAIRDVLTDRMPKFSLPLGEDSVRWTTWLSKEALWARLSTLSQITVLVGEARKELYAKFEKIVDEGVGVERNEKDEIAVHGVTFFAWTSRL